MTIATKVEPVTVEKVTVEMTVRELTELYNAAMEKSRQELVMQPLSGILTLAAARLSLALSRHTLKP